MFWLQIKCISRIGWNHIKVNMYFFCFLLVNKSEQKNTFLILSWILSFPSATFISSFDNTTLTFKTNPMSRLKQMHIHPWHSTNISLIYLRSMWLCAPVFVLSDNVFAQYCQQNSHVLDIYCILFWTRLENLLLVLCFPAVRQYCVSDKVFPQ